jgi:hypothetical protein
MWRVRRRFEAAAAEVTDCVRHRGAKSSDTHAAQATDRRLGAKLLVLPQKFPVSKVSDRRLRGAESSEATAAQAHGLKRGPASGIVNQV